MEIGTPTPIVWYLPQSTTATQFLETVDGFITEAGESGFIAQLRRQHFGRYENVSRVGSLTFQRKIQSDLPAWRPLLETVADEYQMDWRLLAAIAYQESHWNPKAHSRTGVEGMMMLTRATASEMGWRTALMPDRACGVVHDFSKTCCDACLLISKSPPHLHGIGCLQHWLGSS
ncbi:MAG: hypothetical protein CM15mP74_03960 [Halieaceae bacterium]|nr:MAG: hypothetical protein CM15mP74_03960 [Halieaceae bacterium]